MVAILDADKEGYLRSYRSLIQTSGRAARNVRGRVVLYGDFVTDSMKLAIDETARRRNIQAVYNATHGIVPSSITKDIPVLDYGAADEEEEQLELVAESQAQYGTDEAVDTLIQRLEREMKEAAKLLEFERAATLRNRIRSLRLKEIELKSGS